MADPAPISGRECGQYCSHTENVNNDPEELAALGFVVVVTTRCGRLNQISEEIMYKFAIAILLLSAPAFAQNNEVKPDMPQTNMKTTVIPKSGGTQMPENTPTTAAQANQPGTTATRPSKTGPEQTSVPNDSPSATITQTTGASNQSPAVKKMNEDEKKKLETEGK
jgi:cytoskeletal protein RodZ